jgi:hypothetical protein
LPWSSEAIAKTVQCSAARAWPQMTCLAKRCREIFKRGHDSGRARRAWPQTWLLCCGRSAMVTRAAHGGEQMVPNSHAFTRDVGKVDVDDGYGSVDESDRCVPQHLSHPPVLGRRLVRASWRKERHLATAVGAIRYHTCKGRSQPPQPPSFTAQSPWPR